MQRPLIGIALISTLSACSDIPASLPETPATNGTVIIEGTQLETQASTWELSTFVGTETPGYVDGPREIARFNEPNGLAFDREGNLFVVDRQNCAIRKISPKGFVTTVAGGSKGNANGFRHKAQFQYPTDIAVADDGTLFVADPGNSCIRKISPTGEVSTFVGSGQRYPMGNGFADGTGQEARFNMPVGLCLDASGNLYVADDSNQRIRKVTLSGEVTTVAGSTAGFADGPASKAQFYDPQGITCDDQGNLYLADLANMCIRKIATDGMVSTVAGNGTIAMPNQKTNGVFSSPFGVLWVPDNTLVVVDGGSHRVLRVTMAGKVSPIVERYPGGGMAPDSPLYNPYRATLGRKGELFISDRSHHRIRKTRIELQSDPKTESAPDDSASQT